VDMRSRTLHEEWLARLPGAVLRLEDNQCSRRSVGADRSFG
jgi:hypothetical protein